MTTRLTKTLVPGPASTSRFCSYNLRALSWPIVHHLQFFLLPWPNQPARCKIKWSPVRLPGRTPPRLLLVRCLPLDTCVPATVITGFLGSGKTTLFNHIFNFTTWKEDCCN